MIEALVLFGLMCLASAVVCTMADADDDLDLWDDPDE